MHFPEFFSYITKHLLYCSYYEFNYSSTGVLLKTGFWQILMNFFCRPQLENFSHEHVSNEWQQYLNLRIIQEQLFNYCKAFYWNSLFHWKSIEKNTIWFIHEGLLVSNRWNTDFLFMKVCLFQTDGTLTSYSGNSTWGEYLKKKYINIFSIFSFLENLLWVWVLSYWAIYIAFCTIVTYTV